jgi:DNA-directed RNA polymerase sigma subunit (sigma70/sigma32)
MKSAAYERVVEGPDALGLYLKEISQFPQLSAKEEQDVAARAKAGDEDAFRKLIESNLRFVVSVAKKYAPSGYPFHELINEGNMGLIEAASRFVRPWESSQRNHRAESPTRSRSCCWQKPSQPCREDL